MSRVSVNTRRFGYAVAIGIQILLLVVVNNILGWGWLDWLTPEFEELLPIFNFSLVVNIVINIVYMFHDPPRFKSAMQILVNLIAIAVIARMLQIFPFDFSAFSFNWDLMVRAALGLAIFGTAIAVATDVVKLFKSPERA